MKKPVLTPKLIWIIIITIWVVAIISILLRIKYMSTYA
jgi:hypothetical protein